MRQVKARELYGRMMRTLAQTGNGWMTFKDAVQPAVQPDRASRGNVVHLSNLCTEIIEVTTDDRDRGLQPRLDQPRRSTSTATARSTGSKLRETVRTAVPFLDRVIDINYYPSRAGGGVQPALAAGRPGRDGPAGRVLRARACPSTPPRRESCPTRIAEEIYFTALEASAELAEQYGPHPAFAETRAADGQLQLDLWGVAADADRARGRRCASGSRETGLRNSLLIAIAPTATIASIAGCYECIEPQVSNLFKRETLSGEFLQINTAPGRASCKARGLWTPSSPRRDQAGRGLGAGHRRAARRASGSCSAPPGSCRSGR